MTRIERARRSLPAISPVTRIERARARWDEMEAEELKAAATKASDD